MLRIIIVFKLHRNKDQGLRDFNFDKSADVWDLLIFFSFIGKINLKTILEKKIHNLTTIIKQTAF